MNSLPQQDVGVAEIFHQYGDEFVKLYPQPGHHHQLIHLIKSCRTKTLGGHIQKCDNCEYSKPMYNSCRCRMCPKCQTLKKERWVEARKKEIIPSDYVHGVFTLPHKINPLALYNKELIYNLLFGAVAKTLQKFAKQELHGQLGFISVLHTWNQKLNDHIHLHCIIPSGALNKNESQFFKTKNPNFLFPVFALAKVFRAKFLESLREHKDSLKIPASHGYLLREENFNDLIDNLFKTDWVVYAKRPFNGPDQVIQYLGRYTHKTAISNTRILSINQTQVNFKYRDRTEGNVEKTMQIDAIEFLRRFMLHTLPKGFQRIRYFGFLSNRFKNQNIDAIYKILNQVRTLHDNSLLTPKTFFLQKLGIDITRCPLCKTGNLYADHPP